ncbi:MAG: SAM-dependent methyltransferase [Magnetococcales bacterium]|nr:SAM-dependent methyltransferase [Magnetococcales bacterium]MBF0152080.1 SAM-dependent methyltransferase [Magnetococcales bacterium]MBF0175149.1 SAM-dependent methyltransferase [Magnetococcales bacterium]MBF0632986.1 SAM-dependent methyltransferase [Magnetococcales bacterium]
MNEITRLGGVISGERFMELALYHGEHGYYQKMRGPLGREGDYVTAPVMTSLFGELLALQLIEVWELMGAPDTFVLIEAGPGTGHLAEDILRTAKKFPPFNRVVDYRLVEQSPPLRRMQQQRLAQAGMMDRCSWFATLQEAAGEGIEGAIFGNEFLDALPVRWLEMTKGGLVEVGVEVTAAGALTTCHLPLGAGIAHDHFTGLGVDLPVGMRTELGLQAREWMRLAGRLMRRGMVLMIDYGYTAREYYHPERMQGTLVGHSRHRRIDDPLSAPGEMDLTSHVEFSAMARSGASGGLDPAGYTHQGWFLMGLGLLERIEGVMRREGMSLARELQQTAMRLILPGEMGDRFKVLAMTAGMNCPQLSGYRLNNQWDAL